MGRIVYDQKKVQFTTGIRVTADTWDPKNQHLE